MKITLAFVLLVLIYVAVGEEQCRIKMEVGDVTEVTVSWTSSNSPFPSCLVELGSSPEDFHTQFEGVMDELDDGSVRHTIVIDNLAPYHRFYYRVGVSVDEDATSFVWTDVLSFSTPGPNTATKSIRAGNNLSESTPGVDVAVDTMARLSACLARPEYL
eukprot:TRINITY_DN14675_c0_g1_i1.p1 TRINITY_DN14675_c0_g1~~TRINITY_DN14675_c0_g1_i1.p1  ORF type:complete len:159 (-),score=11.18 TRINITY_DN14675_c0_g1_i1:23-499(-)